VLLATGYVEAADRQGSNSSSSFGGWTGWEQLSLQLDTFHLFEHELNAAFMPKWAYPIERGICDNWMLPYAQLHRDILQARKPARYSILR
jgi:hypothetical protein